MTDSKTGAGNTPGTSTNVIVPQQGNFVNDRNLRNTEAGLVHYFDYSGRLINPIHVPEKSNNSLNTRLLPVGVYITHHNLTNQNTKQLMLER